MTKILFINCSEEKVISDTNKGSEAVITSTVNLLRELIPDAEFTSFLNCSEVLSRRLDLKVIKVKTYPNLPRFFGEIKATFGLIKCILWAGVNKYLNANWSFLIRNTRLREYANADVIIYIGMDYYSDDVGLRDMLRHSRDILLGILLKKTVVIWASSTGPFRSTWSRLVARSTLNRVSLITVRNSLSKTFLMETGINRPPLYVTSDPAFLLEPATRDRITEICSEVGITANSGIIIGVNPSHSFIVQSGKKLKTRRDKYIQIMAFIGSSIASLLPEKIFNWILGMMKKSRLYSAIDSEYAEYKAFFSQLINWLVEEYNATILLIPHDQAMAQLFDDRIVTREIRDLTDHKEKVVLISQNYSASEIKGIIGQCELFIGARFHADIAALSQCVPTVCFSYSHKFDLISELGQEKYVCQGYSLEETKTKVTDALLNKDKIRNELESKLPNLMELSALNGSLVKELLGLK